MTDHIKAGLIQRLKQVGAYDVRVADPHAGYEHALPGRHPLQLWPECHAVVVFGVAMSARTNNLYLGPYSEWQGDRDVGPVPQDMQSDQHGMDRLSRLFTASVTLKGMTYLAAQGCGVSFLQPQLKLSAYEAGLGVYGRAGVILHPVLGNRMNLGLIMTDAALPPDGRLEGFEPCEDCDICLRMCPAKAFDANKRYPHSFTRERCIAKRAELATKGLYCHNCWASCPAGKLPDDELLRICEARSLFKGRTGNV